ncbi:hypothetical protein E1301_Tti022729 [Triplophysa tibetana]|uniref:Uncharacterized protein n=1 Tax=Triplophysa tibetana TaxID=1572043 RepID=A0A5A9NAS4_9TELE|nr:hypothetical protein E1301_Tti022729 [Triplophysa tibetana]
MAVNEVGVSGQPSKRVKAQSRAPSDTARLLWSSGITVSRTINGVLCSRPAGVLLGVAFEKARTFAWSLPGMEAWKPTRFHVDADGREQRLETGLIEKASTVDFKRDRPRGSASQGAGAGVPMAVTLTIFSSRDPQARPFKLDQPRVFTTRHPELGLLVARNSPRSSICPPDGAV